MTETNRRKQVLEKVRQTWDNSSHTNDRVLAVHYTEHGQPVDVSAYDELFHQIDLQLNFQQEDVVLEIGAGSGLLLERIAARVKQVNGTDLSAGIIKLVPPLSNVIVETMNSDNLRFADETFDKVICNSVMFYFPDLEYAEKSFAEMVRVCKPGGFIFLGDIFNAYLQSICEQEWNKTSTVKAWLHRQLGQMRGQNSKPDYLFFDPHTIQAWSQELGCQNFKALLELGEHRPLLHRMFRYDVLITK